MKHWFLDTNVLMDFLAARQPFVQQADTLFQLALANRAQLYVASLSFSNLYYLLRRSHGAEEARRLLIDLQENTRLVAVDKHVIDQALQSGFADFEDAIQHFAAVSVPEIEAIITRNGKDFRGSSLRILTPDEAGAQML